MSACPQCGTLARPTDKFCNACGTPMAQSGAPSAPLPGPPPFLSVPPFDPAAPFIPAPPPPPGAGSGPPRGRSPAAHCQMGHEILPGASYCAQGHPFALDQMQFASDVYAGGGAFGAAPTAAAFPTPPPAPPGFGVAPTFASPAVQPPFVAPTPPPPYGVNDTSREAAPAKILRGFLVAYGTNPSGDFWPLQGGRVLVGRFGSAERVDIALQDPTISSRHAAMVVDAGSGTITIEDTGSTNGTFVNDEHIGFNGRRDLRDGDRLRFGAYTAIVKVIGRV